jgi:phenylacetate-CoA ligase
VTTLPVGSGHMSPRRAEMRALRIAQETAAHVPAYARFLRLAGYDPSRLRSFADFQDLPVVDKDAYLARYALEQRCRRGELARAHIVTLSSGTTSTPTLWPRFPEQDAVQIEGFTDILHEHLRIRDRWTLMVVTLAMGSWVAGTMVAEMGQRMFAQPGMRGTVVTPGLNQDETLRFLEQLGPHYDQTFIMGYAAPMAAMLEEGQRRGIDWSVLNLTLSSGSEYVSDGQRERLAQLLGKDLDRLEGFVGLFASSEAGGIIGYESHLCLLVRRLCARTPGLAEALFDSPVVPSLDQYNPLNAFLETHDGQILLTTRGGVPLVRYNTHDRGGILSMEEMVLRCRTFGYDLQAELAARGFGPEYYRPLPFVYVFGRSDAVTVHGANVYADQLTDLLAQQVLRATNSGHFRVATLDQPDGHTLLRLEIELNAGIEGSAALGALYERSIVQGLRRISSEFRAAYEVAGGRIEVEVELVPFGRFALTGAKHRYIERQPTALAAQPAPSADGAHVG